MVAVFKGMMNSNEDLKGLLAAWDVDEELPRRFQADVWTQIAARESSRPRWWTELFNGLTGLLQQPQMAAAVVALGLTLSVGTAYFKAQDSNAMADRQLETRYLETINPLSHASHAS